MALALLVCQASAAAPVAGTIASLTGAVSLKRGNETTNVAINGPIYEGDALVTGANGSVKILFADNSVMDLGPSSQFKVDHFTIDQSGNRNALFSVLYGRLRALVTKATSDKSKFEVHTPSTVMGVRGTEFIVQAPKTGGQTEMTVVTGTVSFGVPSLSQAPALVGAGSTIAVLPGAAAMPTPNQLSASQLKAVTQSAAVRDNTFDRAVTVDAGTQNDKSSSPASNRAIATQNLSLAAQSLKENNGDSLEVHVKGAFGMLDTIDDAPANLIPGNLRAVTVTLSH